MVKTIKIDGKNVRLKSSAAIPRMYRNIFGKDIFKDMMELKKAMDKKKKQGDDLPIENLEMFENIAYIMAKHANPENVPDDIGAWLDQFDTFSIYQVLPEIFELWNLNNKQLEHAKKKNVTSTGKLQQHYSS